MTTYNFDDIIDRRGTDCAKIDALPLLFGRKDVLPLWVADMDFATPPFIMDALRQRLQHPILGYTMMPADMWPAVIDWQRDLHGWEVKKSWLSFVPGVVRGISFVLEVFTLPGDKVIIQPPVYHMFRQTIEGVGREVVNNPLRMNEKGQYEMDFDQLATVAEGAKVLVLCNPHNPGGRCWDESTLQRLATFCAEHKILVVSDEIHADLALFGAKHTPFASVSEAARDNSVTLAAPTKTFNLAGVVSSWVAIPNKNLREPFFAWLKAHELDHPTLFAPIATIAAYREGAAWRQQLLAYLEENVKFVETYCQEHIPGIVALRPEASFLVWMDCRGLGVSHEEVKRLFLEEAHLGLNEGEMFGEGGTGFMRLNIGVPRSVLQQAMEQLADAVARRKG